MTLREQIEEIIVLKSGTALYPHQKVYIAEAIEALTDEMMVKYAEWVQHSYVKTANNYMHKMSNISSNYDPSIQDLLTLFKKENNL